MKHLSAVMYVAGALSLGAIAPLALGCDLPPLVAIPAKDKVGDRAAAVRAETGVYFQGMQSYVGCIQAELAAAGGEAAPDTIKAVLVARNNNAVAEAAAVKKLFEANIGSAGASPGSEAALRKFIEGLSGGMPDYSSMTTELAESTRDSLTDLQGSVSRLGAIREIELRGVDNQGHSVYEVRHEKGWVEWSIGLSADGKIDYAAFLPPDRK
jgi:hypothetical protein